MAPHLPKLSYVLLSYNREKSIRAALESAFAQDYEGELEYIISDDCSTDRTYDIIQECVAAYKGGRRVIVTRTPRNMNLAGNTNHAVQYVESDWIVRADDDDLAPVDRCSIIGRGLASHPGCSCVFTRIQHFTDAEEEEVLKKIRHPHAQNKPARIGNVQQGFDLLKAFCSGCLHQVWSTRHFREFGPLPLDAHYVDDMVSCMRCGILGNALLLDDITMYVRLGSGNMSLGKADLSTGYHAIIRQERFTDLYQNITCAPIRQTVDAITAYAEKRQLTASLQPYLDTLEADWQRRVLLSSYWRKGTLNRLKIRKQLGEHNFFSLIRCLPMPLFAALLCLIRKIKNCCQ